jgi:acetyl esterase/lipase
MPLKRRDKSAATRFAMLTACGLVVGHEYDADPAMLFVPGSSAGGHMAALAALTPTTPPSSAAWVRSREKTHQA